MEKIVECRNCGAELVEPPYCYDCENEVGTEVVGEKFTERAKYLYNGAEDDIDSVIEVVRARAELLRELKDEGWEYARMQGEDYHIIERRESESEFKVDEPLE